MNRLIIIGNGFDLAHGLATRYQDFLLDYLISALSYAHSNDDYKDDILLLTKRLEYWGDEKLKILIDSLKLNQRILKPLLNNKGRIELASGGAIEQLFEFKVKNYFIKALLLSCCERWVDIEEFYYKELLKLVEDDQVDKKIDELNKGFQFLIGKLEGYLSDKIETPAVNEEFMELWLKEEFFVGRLKRKQQPSAINSINRVVFLNFNYTSTLSNYINELIHSYRDIKFDIIHIHGEIDSTENPIIFGFGDEMDDNYKVLEKANDNRLLDYIKSFGYFENYKYKDLVDFIDSESFQVQIMGHSCGLSDRIMLNMIFEHQNCESINVFYHKKGDQDDYKVLTQNISRHFNDKKLMRKRIVPKVTSVEMPQLGG